MELIFQYICENKKDVVELLNLEEIVMSAEGECRTATKDGVTVHEGLRSNQAEADTQLILHAIEALTTTADNVCIHSPSGDTDVIILAIVHWWEFREQVTLVNGSGKNKKMYHMKDIVVEDRICMALIGFHAFTGTYYYIKLYFSTSYFHYRIVNIYKCCHTYLTHQINI